LNAVEHGDSKQMKQMFITKQPPVPPAHVYDSSRSISHPTYVLLLCVYCLLQGPGRPKKVKPDTEEADGEDAPPAKRVRTNSIVIGVCPVSYASTAKRRLLLWLSA
jgi:hypothetical protein